MTPARRGDLRAETDMKVAGEPRLPPQRGKILENAGARNAALRDEDAVAANDDVVADLHKVIDFRSFADDRVAVGAAVDGRAGADLDVVLNDHAPDLRHFHVALRTEGEAEPVLPDVDAGVDDDAVAD